MDVISSASDIGNGAVTWHSQSMARAAPCVLSCRVQTKMTPIMPIKIRSAAAVPLLRRRHYWETHKGPDGTAGQWGRRGFQNQRRGLYGSGGGGLKSTFFSPR